MSDQGREGVAAAFDRMTVATNDFTKAVNRLRHGQNRVLAVLVLLVVLLVGLAVVGYQLFDCTVEGRSCYQKGAKRTGAVVGNLILSDVRVSECVVSSQGDVPAFRACVKAKGLPVE
jgi:hypothetical protein